jgi:hypothetical protein
LDTTQQKESAFESFRKELPAALTRMVEPFSSHQWSLMVLLHAQPSALDWVSVNPVLAYCLANNHELRGTLPDAAAIQATWYGQRKQRAILKWLGFPGDEATVRLMRKIAPEAASPSMLRRLKMAMASDKSVPTLIAHLTRINAGVLALVATGQIAGLITPQLLTEVAENEDEFTMPLTADLLLDGLSVFRGMDPQGFIQPLTRMEQVRRFQENARAEFEAFLRRREEARLAAERAREQRAAELRAGQARQWAAAQQARYENDRRLHAEAVKKPFPSPPVPGTADIVPLQSADELKAEGVEQRNCVGSYVLSVIEGRKYIYRVLAPQRATLAICRGPDGCWRRSELKAGRNKSVQYRTVCAVERWLNEYRVSV